MATASGSIFYLAADTLQLQGEIEFPSGKVQLSASGSVLAAWANSEFAQYATDRTLKVFSLPSETLLAEWLHTLPNDNLWDFTLSLSGDVIGQVTGPSTGPSTASVTLLDGTPVWTSTVGVGPDIRPIRLSPNDQMIAMADGASVTSTSSNIYSGATLTNSLLGHALGWVDDNQILLNRHGPSGYLGVDLRTAAGQYTAALIPLPLLSEAQVVSPTSIYSPRQNAIYSLINGSLLWNSSTPHGLQGAVAGTNVVFASESTVRVEPL